ncbi:MAG: Mpo1-like protein [Phycisphaerae bacterium]
MTSAWYTHWRRRHQHPVSFALHLLGIPLTIASIPLAVVQLSQDQWNLWWRPVALLVGGYLLQWIGHLIEGNDMGEVILIKKRLGKPYTAVSPKYADPPNISQPEHTDPQQDP